MQATPGEFLESLRRADQDAPPSGRRFLDIAWKNLADAGRTASLAPRRRRGHPHCNASRIGITGASACEQNASGGLQVHCDFYRVAIVRNGCHGNLMALHPVVNTR